MMKEMMANLYQNKIPLPRNPLREINSYLIKGPERNLIIDTGMNREECMTVMSAGLKELDVDLNKTDFFITHLHADHLGLVSSLATETSTIYFNRPDGTAVNSDGNWDHNGRFADSNGFTPEERQQALDNHPGRRYASRKGLPFHFVGEGDIISIADYSFQCVTTPGHTRGHTCLYEPDKKLLLSGDHILIDITPNISLWSDDEDPLDEYLHSLDKINELDIKQVLPGHRRTFKNCSKRIAQLKHHHEVRADEVLNILESGARNAFQVASHMTWDMNYASWAEFPPQQKWFAFGEAVAHLKYLEGQGKVQKDKKSPVAVYSLEK